ncbi:family 16 glycosylhydrolase [Arthrobacter sp. NPDC057388]|uniref:glycoside hydrolase family 16 protein n=1 Tax=Arthrobacter sp. NPDC057388 TaxID=3346116 RepID=UPI0036343E3C
MRRFGVIAAVATLTACGFIAGPVAMEGQKLSPDQVPAPEPSGSSAPVPSVSPSRAAGSARGTSPKQSAATPSAAAPPAAAPPAATQSAAPRPAPELRAQEQPAAEQPARKRQQSDAALVHKLPTGDLPGWKQVFREQFDKGDVPVGAFPGPAYSAKWSAGYKDGTPDTAGQKGAKSGYYPSKVLSVKNGMLDWYLHSEDGIAMGAAPSPKISSDNTVPSRDPSLLPRHNSLLYGRISVRFKADALRGYKIAWLLWPDSGVWPRDGEIDFPEGDLARSFYGAAHYRGNDPSASDMFRSEVFFTDWHVATIEWSPGKVEFILDGKSLGASTTLTPNTPMHYLLQTEACLPRCPAPQTAGHVYLDWIAVWKRA